MLFPDALAGLPASHPLFVHYDEDAGTRIELSAVTFRNWVDKTANLLDELGIDPEDRVQLDLVASHPGYWATWVWVAAIWQRAAVVTVDPGELTVLAAGRSTTYPEPVVCSMHPLGAPVTDLPEGCHDFAEVLAQPDLHLAEPVLPDALAWDDGTQQVTHQQVASVPPRSTVGVLSDPRAGWEDLSRLVVAPILGCGTTVSVTGGDGGSLARIISQEHGELL